MMINFLRKMYAYLFGYAWLPCPRCGKYFSGHEINHLTKSIRVGDSFFVVCQECSKEIRNDGVRSV